MKTWNGDSNYLQRFDQNRRSHIANLFCYAVRDNCRTVDEIFSYLNKDITGRIADLESSRFETDYERIEFYNKLSRSLSFSEAKEFAQFILWRESLPYEEKQRLKKTANNDFVKSAMSAQPPTERQIAYLRSLGCKENPASKLEASELIGKYKSGETTQKAA